MVTVEEISELKEWVGRELGVSDWVLVDQQRIDTFAIATGDHQWIHVDTERAARELPGGRTIAHGYLTLALLPMLCAQNLVINRSSRRINYGLNKVRFTGMVPVGSRVRARQKLLSVEPVKGDGFQLISEVTFEIEGQERPACVAESISIAYP